MTSTAPGSVFRPRSGGRQGPSGGCQAVADGRRVRLDPLSATGTALLFTAIAAAVYLRLRPAEVGRILLGTLSRVKTSLLTIAAMLAIACTGRFAGLDASMGLAFASTGGLFAFFSPLLGWLGVALTGSDTSSNALFGNLQQITAQQSGLSPVLTTAANSSGGVMAKMIDAQSIVVAGVATGQQGNEGEILRYGFGHSVALGCLMGVLVFLQSNLLSLDDPGCSRSHGRQRFGP